MQKIVEVSKLWSFISSVKSGKIKKEKVEFKVERTA